MVYLIHLERSRTEIQHCIAILTNDAGETLNLYYIHPHSRLRANLLALGAEWTFIRLWEEGPWYKQWLRNPGKSTSVCPNCGIKS
jgi:hypothetical protein